MNTPTKYLSILGLTIALGACSDDSMRFNPDKDLQQLPITLSAAYPTATRASDDGFEDGDRMGVYVMDYKDGEVQEIDASDVHVANERFEFNGSDNIWNAGNPVYWSSKDTPADIIGYYPYSNDINTPTGFPFSIVSRQDLSGNDSEPGGYEASDFLWAKAEKVMPTDSKVNLTFRHLMAGVRVTLKEGTGFDNGEWEKLEKVVLIPEVKPSTSVNIATGEVGTATGDAVSIRTYRYGDNWRAIVVPQTIEARKNAIDISVGNVGYHLTTEKLVQYISGKLTSFTITVNKRQDNGEYEFNLTDESITAWLDNTDFRDGIVRNYMIVNVEKKGTLKNLLTNKGLALNSIRSLKITGEIDNSDFDCLRDDLTSLSALNLQECTVWNDNRKNVIPEGAFSAKKVLKHIVFPHNLEVLGTGAFRSSGLVGSIVLPDGLKKIGENKYSPINTVGVFCNCKGLSGELHLPASVEYIEDAAFWGTNMRGVLKFPESLKFIGADAFRDNKFSGELILPENLEEIGSFAFGDNRFTGSCVIPKSITIIKDYAFCCSGFNGSLILHDGITSIGNRAFLECGFKGELTLPSSLTEIGECAFLKTNISSIVFSENINYIGAAAFAYCKNLKGTVEIPKKVLKINDYLFYGCSLLGELILHEDISFLGGGILSECHSLKGIECKALEPPLTRDCNLDYYLYYDDEDELPVTIKTFEGISKSNFTLTVPRESIESYKRSKGWNEFNRIAEYSNFVCRPTSVCALNKKHSEKLILNSDGEWEVVDKPDWCTLSKTSGNLKTEITLTINDLSQGAENREGKIVFNLKGTDITSECNVSQYDYTYNEDECITLQKATKGNGIDILFLGDGWDAESIANRNYLSIVNEQMEDFFGVEPYTTYRDRFNVYACVSLSQEAGINTAHTWRNTKFKTLFADGKLVFEDADAVFDYAVNCSPLKFENLSESLIIMNLNSDEYGSATVITEKGNAISICCTSTDTYPMDTRGIIQHEACGHAFGKLAEERILKNRYISESEKNKIMEYQWHGWYQNISLTGNVNDVHWSHFIFDPRYSDKVDVFEGAYGKAHGVYRAEINSCMNYGIPYFSAAARMDIMKRILEYSGEEFTMEKFYATDSDKWGSTDNSTRAAMPGEDMQYVNSGLHHPVRIIKSKKY